ncbi:hypothetical protein BH11ACT8_BH11ACT8_22010 [soil metagenome]
MNVVASSLRTVGVLALLQVALPVNAALTAVALTRGALLGTSSSEAADRTAGASRTVLISGGKMTKALQLARSFHAAGHRVVLVESAKYRLTGHRFSRAVDVFHTVPSPQDPGYAEALRTIVEQEGVDVYVPVCSPLASYYDALAAEVLAPLCEVLHLDAEMVATLDDKERFAALAASLGLGVPESHRITDPRQVAAFDFAARPGRSFILKSLAYDPVHRLDLTLLPRPTPEETADFARSKPMTPSNPWVLQEFVVGQEYCTHSTVRDGAVQVYCCCESSAFQINYAMRDKPEIEEWVTRFVGELGLTGQVSFDFIESADGRVHAIECNPRTHSAITMLYDHPDVARAYLEPYADSERPVVTPTATSRPTYWIYHELWRLLRRPGDARHRLRVIGEGKDAIFDWADPLPFLMVHHVQLPWLLLQNLRHGTGWVRVDFNIGKLVEPAGD